jgi:hypothetical protein
MDLSTTQEATRCLGPYRHTVLPIYFYNIRFVVTLNILSFFKYFIVQSNIYIYIYIYIYN